MILIEPNRMRRIVAAVITVLLFALPASSSARGADERPDTLLAILQLADMVPQDALKLKEISLNGNSYGLDCAYYELLLKAKSMAREAGANLLKITRRTQHSRTQHCDGLDIALYQAPDPRGAEQSFQWNASRPLTWDDFKGPVRAGSADHIAAETSCGIAIETNLVSAGGKAKVYVFNTFDKRTSWVRPEKEQPGILEHEQGHWNICELYTRKMQARFDQTDITGATLNRKVNEIYGAFSRDYLKRQAQYEEDTQHGVVPAEQQRWTKLIREELGQDMTGRL